MIRVSCPDPRFSADRTVCEHDLAEIDERIDVYNERPGPRVGDWVDFADGTTRRVSHDWGDEVQTSDGGSWYLGRGYVSFSGSLHPSTPKTALHRTRETRPGLVWIFHHDHHTAHNGVTAHANFPVWATAEEAPR